MKKQIRMTSVSDVPVVTLLTRVGVTSILAAVIAALFVADSLSTVLAASPAATDKHGSAICVISVNVRSGGSIKAL